MHSQVVQPLAKKRLVGMNDVAEGLQNRCVRLGRPRDPVRKAKCGRFVPKYELPSLLMCGTFCAIKTYTDLCWRVVYTLCQPPEDLIDQLCSMSGHEVAHLITREFACTVEAFLQ
jgi:hypothetical protein